MAKAPPTKALPRNRVTLSRPGGEALDPRVLQQNAAQALEMLQRGRGRIAHTYRKETADATAGTTTAETLVFQNAVGFDRRIEQITFTGNVAVPFVDDTLPANYAKINVYKRLAVGGDDTALAAGDPGRIRIARLVGTLTNFGHNITPRGKAWPQFAAATFEFTGQSLTLKSGETLTFDIQKVGTGQIVPAGLLTLWLVDA